MTLAEFRKMTANLPGDVEMLCGGVRTGAVWCDEDELAHVTIDDDEDYPAEEYGNKVLFREPNPEWHAYVNTKGGVPG